jgi:hypothetical protein
MRNLVYQIRTGHRLRVFENMVLRRIFRPKRDEVTGEWKKLHKKQLHDSHKYHSSDQIEKNERG